MTEPASAYDEAKRAARAALRSRLLQVAGERLETAGLEGLSMRPLARAAGCSTMVFYTEFGSKEGLLEALADELTARVLESVETVADIDVEVHRQAVVQAFLDVVETMPEGYRVMVRAPVEPGVQETSERDRRRRFDERLVAALRPIDEGGTSEAMARGLVLALRGAAEHLVVGLRSRDEIESALYALVRASARQDAGSTAL